MLTTSDAIRKFVRENPRCTNRSIGDALGVASKKVAVVTLEETRKGRFSREVLGETVSGIQIYGYSWVSAMTKTQKKRQVVSNETAPKKTLEKVSAAPLESLLDQIGQAIAQRLTGVIKEHIETALTSFLPKQQSSAKLILPSVEDIISRTQEQSAPKERKQKVVVIGLLPTQEGQIMTEFHDALDLTFWNDRTGGGMDQLRSAAKASDMVLIHTAHVSHKVGELLKSVGAEFKNVTGGVTSMREALLNYYVNAKEKQQ